MADRIFVTGAGIISALGVGSEATLRSLMEGKTGIGRIRHLDTEHEEFPVGEVALSNADMSRMLDVGYPEDGIRTVLMGLSLIHI